MHFPGLAIILKKGHFLHSKKRGQNMQHSEFAYFSSKSGKHVKQMPNPPFLRDVGAKKWSPFFYLGARSPIFGHLKMPKVSIRSRSCWRMRPGSFLQNERGEGCGKRKTQYSVRALEQKMGTIETFPGAIGRHISLSPHQQIYLMLQGATPDKNLHLWFATPERSISQISRCIF